MLRFFYGVMILWGLAVMACDGDEQNAQGVRDDAVLVVDTGPYGPTSTSASALGSSPRSPRGIEWPCSSVPPLTAS